MNGNRGSILTITLSFVLIFSLLGIAIMRRATVQNETIERRTASEEALWAADAAVEMIRSNLGKPPAQHLAKGTVFNNQLGDGNYSVFYEDDPACPTCIDRWHVQSQATVNINNTDGTINTQSRGIDAIVASYDIENAITTHGTVNGSCVPSGNAQIVGDCEAHVDFTFETVFNGKSYSDFQAAAAANPIDVAHPIYSFPDVVNHKFHLSGSADEFEVKDVTVIFMEDNFNTVLINTDDSDVYTGPSLLIVDTTGSEASTPEVKVSGNVGFCGVLWIIGHVKIAGTSVINGAIFIDESPPDDTTVTGNTNVIFDPGCVQQAIDSMGVGVIGAPGIISWKEFSL